MNKEEFIENFLKGKKISEIRVSEDRYSLSDEIDKNGVRWERSTLSGRQTITIEVEKE